MQPSPVILLNPFCWEVPAWKRFFVVAGLWNWLGAVPLLLLPNLALRGFYRYENPDFMIFCLHESFWIAVLLLGLGYFIVAADPRRHAGIVFMGIVGKSSVAIAWTALFFQGRATALVLLAASGDTLFTLFFILFLVHGIRNTPMIAYRRSVDAGS